MSGQSPANGTEPVSDAGFMVGVHSMKSRKHLPARADEWRWVVVWIVAQQKQGRQGRSEVGSKRYQCLGIRLMPGQSTSCAVATARDFLRASW